MKIPEQLETDFKEWTKTRKTCPFLGNYCMLIGLPCCFLHCLFRTSQLMTYDISCPKCGRKVKFPLETKCVCGYNFEEAVSNVNSRNGSEWIHRESFSETTP